MWKCQLDEVMSSQPPLLLHFRVALAIASCADVLMASSPVPSPWKLWRIAWWAKRTPVWKARLASFHTTTKCPLEMNTKASQRKHNISKLGRFTCRFAVAARISWQKWAPTKRRALPCLECNVLEENIHHQGLHCGLQSLLEVRVHQEQMMLLHGNKAGHLRCPVLVAGKTDELSSDSYKKNLTHKKGFQKL